jgi:hypothetical protein
MALLLRSVRLVAAVAELYTLGVPRMAAIIRYEGSKRRLPLGWIAVVVLVAFTPVLHAFIISASHRGVAAGHALTIGSAAIGVRAIAGICLRDQSRRWIAYALLYPFLIVVTGILSAVFYP